MIVDDITKPLTGSLQQGEVLKVKVISGSARVDITFNNSLISSTIITKSKNFDDYDKTVNYKITLISGLVDVYEINDTEETISSDLNVILPKTFAGTYTGNGTTQAVALGFRPDFVMVKGNTAQAAVFTNNTNFMQRTDHFLNIASIQEEFGITITDTGFSVGNDNKVNANAVAYYYFAYADNGSDNLLQGNWQGNSAAGRTVELFKRKPISGIVAKRDSARAAVWIVGDAANNYFFDGANNAVSTGTTLNSETGVLTVGSGIEINQWAGLLGEGVNALAFAKNSEAVFVKTYIGTGTARNVTLPWEPDCLFILPRDVSSATSRAWISSVPAGNSFSLSTGALGTGEFIVSGSRIAFAGATQNATGVEYGIFAFRKLRGTTWTPQNQYPAIITKGVEIANNGYIDCGTSDSLKISGALTMEWYGTVYAPDTTQYAGTADIDTLAGNQDKLTPLIFRSGGVDGAANVSFGMAIAAGQVSVDAYVDLCILVATSPAWGLLQSNASGDLDNHPMNTGITVDANQPVHIIATHAGNGHWTLYVNGQIIKERKRNLATNIVGGTGHRTVIGARQRDTIANANGGCFRLARIYSRALTALEAKNNYLSVFGKATAATDFVEQWNANNASGTSLPASVNAANNGTINTGTVI